MHGPFEASVGSRLARPPQTGRGAGAPPAPWLPIEESEPPSPERVAALPRCPAPWLPAEESEPPSPGEGFADIESICADLPPHADIPIRATATSAIEAR